MKIYFLFLVTCLFLFHANFVYAKENHSDLLEKSTNITDEIKYDFPSIQNKKITIDIKKINEGSAEAKKYPIKGYVIVIDPEKLQNVSYFELKGLFAHEFSHLEQYSKMSWLQLGFFAILYSVSDDFKKRVERKTDMTVIEKGFGRELLAFREYRLRTGSEQDKKALIDHYLSLEEIRNLTKTSQFYK